MGLIRKFIFGSPDPKSIASKITWRVGKSSFKIFRDRKVRELLKFEELEQTEQDRIFNEFVLSGLSLIYLMLETAVHAYDDERIRDLHQFAKDSKAELFGSYQNTLKDVVAVGGLQHIRRGKTSPEDPFYKIFYEWVGSVALDAEIILIRALKRMA